MGLVRFFTSLLVLVLTATAVSAYTIVMRDGRRVEIPNEFTVAKSTLTYEVSSSIQITIQLASINIAATERANNQAPGSLLLKGSAPKVVPQITQTRPAADRSITNQDLEAYRRTRVQNELAYEKRRKELGLPSLEDQRRELAAIEERTREQLLEMRSQEQGSEEYWRSRASALRTEMVSNQAQIDFVRRRLDEIPLSYSFGSFATTIPFGTVGTPIVNFPFQGLLTPNVFAPSIVTGNSTRFGASVGFQRRFHTGRRMFPGMGHPGRFHRGHRGGRFNSFFGGSVLALPFQSFDDSFERTELVSQLNELEMQRAGLKARWRELEEEARRAGAYPGWLRP